jgi:hypothetical protein
VFSYGYKENNSGRIVIGDGCDENPLYFTLTTKRMLGVLETAIRCRSIRPVVLHLDSTFKLNINEFPGFVIGVSDAYQTLHPLCVVITSHQTKELYKRSIKVRNPQYMIMILTCFY